jgi:hypothetical protein
MTAGIVAMTSSQTSLLSGFLTRSRIIVRAASARPQSPRQGATEHRSAYEFRWTAQQILAQIQGSGARDGLKFRQVACTIPSQAA